MEVTGSITVGAQSVEDWAWSLRKQKRGPDVVRLLLCSLNLKSFQAFNP